MFAGIVACVTPATQTLQILRDPSLFLLIFKINFLGEKNSSGIGCVAQAMIPDSDPDRDPDPCVNTFQVCSEHSTRARELPGGTGHPREVQDGSQPRFEPALNYGCSSGPGLSAADLGELAVFCEKHNSPELAGRRL